MPNKRAGHLWDNSGSFLFLTSPFLLFWAFFWVVPLFTGVDLAMQESQQFSRSLPGTGYTHSRFPILNGQSTILNLYIPWKIPRYLWVDPSSLLWG